MKKIYASFFAVLIMSSISTAQEIQSTNRNFYQIRKQFLEQYEQLERQNQIDKEDPDGDGLIQQFRRWEYMTERRVYADGTIPPGKIQWQEWEKYQSTHVDQFAGLASQPAWKQVGTNTIPLQGGGAGRVNVVRFDPDSLGNTYYVGTANGGVWKTTDGGTSWTPLGDQFPVTSIADIAIDPTNGSNIYVATGDGAGYEIGANDDFWGGVYSAGILRSTDAGKTWALVGRELPQAMHLIIQRLIIHPSNNKILLAATRQGIYRSSDAGNTWKIVLAKHCYDMEWNTGNANIVYAGGDDVLYQSADAGATWTTLKSGLGPGRMSIEVSASNPDVIYSITGIGFLRSMDGGKTWASRTYPYEASFYGYYDLVLSCAAVNSDYLIAGGLNTVKSIDGGRSWTLVDNWNNYKAANYVHADKHHAIFYPDGNTRILLGTDGGIFESTDGGTTWADRSKGLMIAQVYRLGTTPQNVNLVTSGWQDNGCNKWDGTKWTRIFGADGMETAIDRTNQNTIYESYQYGALNRSYTGGTSWTYIAPSSGDWVTPFVVDPVVYTRLYYGGINLYKTDNRGDNWSAISGLNFGGYVQAIAVAPSNNSIVYSASLTKMYKTNISTGNSTDITAGLPVSKTGINYIAVSAANPDHVWVALAGYSSGNKVFRSTNGGSTWTNVSGLLPNLPINTIVHQDNIPNGRLYIGTDVGVFYIDSTLSDWKIYGKNLPAVIVHELEINYTSNKLVAATYGRGIWQINVQPLEPMVAKSNTTELKVNVYPNPTRGILNLQVENATQDVQVTVYKLTGEKVASYHYAAASAKSIRLDISNKPFGNYLIYVQSGDAVATKPVLLEK